MALLLLLAAVLIPSNVRAQEQPVLEIRYTTTNNEAVSLASSFSSYIESNTYNNGEGVLRYKDDDIFGEMFLNQTTLLSITLPEGIVSIGQYAFSGCTSLSSILVPSTLKQVGNYAFAGCTGLSVLDFKSVPQMGSDVFYSTTTKTLTLSDGSYVYTENDNNFPYLTSATYQRQMANQWGTLVLPFPITYDTSNANYKLYWLSAVSSTELTFEEFGNRTIAAGTPMAIKATGSKESDGKYHITLSETSPLGVGVSTAIKPYTGVDGWTMTGTYSNLTNQSALYYIAQNQFWYALNDITIAPFRAWFKGPIPASSGDVKTFSIQVDEDDETTSIDDEQLIINKEMRDGTSANGRKVRLENGRIVIWHGGQKYGLTGQRW